MHLRYAVLLSAFLAAPLLAQPGTVLAHQKISDTEGGFTGTLDNLDFFGSSTAAIGDLDGNGIPDLAVGASADDDGGVNRGAVWVLFLNADGTVLAHQKISSMEGGFTGVLDDGDGFGRSVAALGDLDGNGVTDLAVGAYGDDDGVHTDQGAVWVLFLIADGTVANHQKISSNEGGFTGFLENDDYFGWSVAALGDLDGTGVTELAVGAQLDDDGGSARGAVWTLFLNADGTVASHQKISDTEGGFAGGLEDGDVFGFSVAALGDLDGDGTRDLAVGARRDGDGGPSRGAVWVLFLQADGSVNAHQKISSTEGGFGGMLDDEDVFGFSLAAVGDLDGDSMTDLAVGAAGDDDGGTDRGAVWVVFLNEDGTVAAHQKISNTEGGFTGMLDDEDDFGSSVAMLGDLDGDGVSELAVGASLDDDGGSHRGAAWILFLDGEATTNSGGEVPVSSAFTLDSTYPNPFTDAMTVGYSLAKAGHVMIAVYDMMGRRIAVLVDLELPAGSHTVQWHALNDHSVPIASGVYLVRLQSGDHMASQKIHLLQ